jgi:hypothetical protein
VAKHGLIEIDIRRASHGDFAVKRISEQIEPGIGSAAGGKPLEPQAVIVGRDHWIGFRENPPQHRGWDVKPRLHDIHNRPQQFRCPPRIRQPPFEKERIRVVAFPKCRQP